MTRLLSVMADHALDAIVHKAVEHQPTLIRDGVASLDCVNIQNR